MSHKPIFYLLICLVLLTGVAAKAQKYNQHLADSLGADEYGMKMYVLVMLKAGSNTEDSKLRDSVFRGHLANIGRLVKEGKIIVAGPLGDNDKNYRGIFILNVKTTEEAKTLLQTDPAVKAKLLDYDLYQWYGSAALPMYLPYDGQVRKKNF